MAGTGLNVVALISGGKDSLFSILHCQANGHQIVALANLHPPEVEQDDDGHQVENKEDLDSFMFQTVGHSVIPQYADVLGLPLYRRPISGSAVNQSLEYASLGHDGDEAEDMTHLLRQVMAEHPEVNAVSTGAILSTYQRTRVESVAARLGLIPLGYLWQYPYLPPYREQSLLEDMRNAGQVSKIIKVASGGLDDSFLDTDVATARTIAKLASHMRRFDGQVGSVLGEGGEFETLAVRGSPPLWKKVIVTGKSSVIHGDGGSAHIVYNEVSTGPLPDSAGSITDLRIPPLLDDEFQEIFDAITPAQTSKTATASHQNQQPASAYFGVTGNKLSANGHSNHGKNVFAKESSISEQFASIAAKWQGQFDPDYTVSSMILLRNMEDFSTINGEYSRIFNKANPPSRITIAIGSLMPLGIDMLWNFRTEPDERAKRALHVQGRSYWAPANIGPYSQAIAYPLGTENDRSELVHIAGQIPLVPARMDLPVAKDLQPSEGEETHQLLKLQVVLALQHLWRIGRAMQVSCFAGAVAFIPQCVEVERQQLISLAPQAWQRIHEKAQAVNDTSGDEDDGFDVWHLQHGTQTQSANSNSKDTRSALPDFTYLGGSHIPPCYVVQVSELPRSSMIEWASLGLKNTRVLCDRSVSEGVVRHDVFCPDVSLRLVYLGFEASSLDISLADHAIFKLCQADSVHTTVYTTPSVEPGFWIPVNPTVVPCFGVWDENGALFDMLAVVEVRNELAMMTSYPDIGT